MQKIMFNERYRLEQAVIDRIKTMTRRTAYDGEISKPNWGICLEGKDKGKAYLCDGERVISKSKYAIGEEVAIAQSYHDIGMPPTECIDGLYRRWCDEPGWTNKMFVKAELMRYRIKITDIRVERLQDISERDCLKEGVHRGQIIPVRIGATFRDEMDIYYPFRDIDPYNWHYDYKKAFAVLIDKVSGKGTWESNPWVFVYEFELVKGGTK